MKIWVQIHRKDNFCLTWLQRCCFVSVANVTNAPPVHIGSFGISAHSKGHVVQRFVQKSNR